MNRYLRREKRQQDWRQAAWGVRPEHRARRPNVLVDASSGTVHLLPAPAPKPVMRECRKVVIDQDTGRISMIRHFYVEVVQ